MPGCTGTSVDTSAIERLQTRAGTTTRALTGANGVDDEHESDAAELYGLRPVDGINQSANIHHRDSATLTSSSSWKTDSQLLCATPNQLHHLDLRAHTQVSQLVQVCYVRVRIRG